MAGGKIDPLIAGSHNTLQRELQSKVDPDILGGLVLQVGNMVWDTSIRHRLEKLRKSVATAA